jgi:protein-disulfide isomerase-like protein with CxxC motif
MNFISPDAENLRRAHPLAVALIERLGANSGARVLEIACGRGRNTAALRAAALCVHAIPDEAVGEFETRGTFDAALSTHGFLHGTPPATDALVVRTAAALHAGALFYSTFASASDARYGKGRRVAADTFAPESGNEAGVPHRYFTESSLRALLIPYFDIESLDERNVDAIVGRWAHEAPPSGSVHFFVRATKRG